MASREVGAPGDADSSRWLLRCCDQAQSRSPAADEGGSTTQGHTVPAPSELWDGGARRRAERSVPGFCALTAACDFQIVLLKDQKKCFSLDSPGYEPEVVAVHPSGDTVAVGGTVSVLSLASSAPGCGGGLGVTRNV